MPETAMLTVKISKDTKDKLDKWCEDYGHKMRWAVEQAIITYLSDEYDEKFVDPPKAKQ